MAVLSNGRFEILRYEPGNPQFPTLPDGVQVPHIISFGSAPGKAAVEIEGRRVFSAGPNVDDQRASGWQDQTAWISPFTLDFGVITSPVRLTIAIYNSYPTSTDVTAVNMGSNGVTLISPTLTETLPPYDGVTFIIEAGLSGPPTFDEVVSFTTSKGTLQFRIIGRRVFSLNVVPEAPMRETLQFNTDLLRSTDGTEKAYSLLQSPNAVVDYKVRFTDDLERIRFRNQFIAGESALVVGAQKWYEARFITSAALSTDLTIQVDTTNGSFVAGKPLSIYLPDGTHVPATIESLTTTSVTFSVAIGTDIPLGSAVMPVGLGYISKLPRYDTHPVNVEDATYQVTFNQETNQGTALPGIFPTIGGVPILEFYNEVPGGVHIPTTMARAEERIDSRLSNRLAFSRYPYSDEIQGFTTVLHSAEEIWDWREFLHYMKGSYREMYVPTFQQDFPGIVTTATNTFTVDDTDYAILFGTTSPSERRDTLRFEYDDGTILYRKITAVVDNGATEEFTVDTAVNAGTPKVSFMNLSRILGDTATFTFARPDLAELKFRYRTILK